MAPTIKMKKALGTCGGLKSHFLTGYVIILFISLFMFRLISTNNNNSAVEVINSNCARP